MENPVYRKYFDIDPEYLAQINEAEIESHPDLWKGFYPHATFVKLLKDTISVISRKQKLSIWVEGAYGTGKSHAVLTLKKLLDLPDEEVKPYFEKYSDQLSPDLYNKFQQIKGGDQRILTVHRYGSSDIHGDDDLAIAMQQSIVMALQKSGIEDHAEGALADSTIKWLSDDYSKDYFNNIIQRDYRELFGGDTADVVIEKLNKYREEAKQQPSAGEPLQMLMKKILKVAKEKGITALQLSIDTLIEWIQDIIKRNNLKAIVFIWDEFTDYFRNNMQAMTGFQKVADLSGDNPFYLIIVTHNVTHLFPDSNEDWKRVKDRFIDPICNIELPENMAFQLMGNAMAEVDDKVVQDEWHEVRDELYNRTKDSRTLVMRKARINDKELKKILPIHPYAALLLKHISSAFDSNQRSMFDFIKNDRGDEIKGFQWFIDNCGPVDPNPYLTIDMLWDFFYEKGKQYLSQDIRTILDCFNQASGQNLDDNEQRVLKTVLLLQAISQHTGDSVELFIPNERNLNNAFDGTDLPNDEAVRIANHMVPDILYRKPMAGGKTQYAAMTNVGNMVEIEKEKEKNKSKTTAALIDEAEIEEAIPLSGALKLRYEIKYVTVANFTKTINQLRNSADGAGNKILAVAAFAKNNEEHIRLGKDIKSAVESDNYPIVFIDASSSILEADLLEQYAEDMAYCTVNLNSDKGLAKQYETRAKDTLKKWRNSVSNGEFIIYSRIKPEGERVQTAEQLIDYLSIINRRRYPEGLENIRDVNDTMWDANALPQGVECGAEENTKSRYRSGNKQTKLELYIGEEAWKVPNYWEKSPYLPISKIKIALDQLIHEELEKNGRISIRQIYDFLQDKDGKYGVMPCNLTAFVMGFLLKEYVNGTYNYSNGDVTDVLDVGKLKEIVAEIIKNQNTPKARYKDKFIVTTTPEEKAFNQASSRIFEIPIQYCTSIEQTRNYIRQKMKELSFPIWVLKYRLNELQLKTDASVISDLIERFGGIANNGNISGLNTESEIANDIGKICLKNADAVDELAELVTKDNCTKGMEAYLKNYREGELPALASQVQDNGQYINGLRAKFDADAANWVWNIDTANQKIDEIILEYQIIVASNKILPKNVSFDATIREWIDTCRHIMISYQCAKNDWDDLSDLMARLYTISKTGKLEDSQKARFLEQISVNGQAFKEFYGNQTERLKRVCAYRLERYTDEEVKGISRKLPDNLFTADKATFLKTIDAVADQYDSEQSSTRLKKLWREKTHTDSPKEWSEQYKTPILCMIPENELSTARKAFDTFNKRNADTNTIDKTIEFLENADFYDRLDSREERDRAFREKIVKSYSVMLDDLDEVRNYLSDHVQASPYDWFGYASPDVDKKLKQKAEHTYNTTGYEKALDKIDSMDVSDVKRYLKDLIKDNMVVGMEIIKEDK